MKDGVSKLSTFSVWMWCSEARFASMLRLVVEGFLTLLGDGPGLGWRRMSSVEKDGMR